MINKLNVLAVIPARGGSKGIPLKNLKKVGGIPMVELAAKVASSVDIIDRIIVSTDSEDIAQAAINGGADAPFFRPENLSGDRISDLQVLTHALIEIEKIDKKKYDVVVMLQPTSPLRKKQHVYDSIKMLVNDNYDSVWSVSETDSKSHPYKQLTVEDNRIGYYDIKGKKIVARQQLKTLYHRNGASYAFSRDCLLIKKDIMGDNTGALICDTNMISIDTEWDLMLTNFLKEMATK
jgi:CMP-N,N'-diacetyllegionaminic acid synthase